MHLQQSVYSTLDSVLHIVAKLSGHQGQHDKREETCVAKQHYTAG
jgi:hypothetical protein